MSSANKPCILIAGGGTGGHLYPGLSLAGELMRQNPQARVAFAGTRNGLEGDLVPKAGFELFLLSTGRGSPLSVRRPLNSLKFVKAFLECRKLFREMRPQVVVSLGGFAASVPGLYAAFSGVPLVCLEQNVIPGRVTRLLSRWAAQIHVQFAESKSYLEKARGEIIASGSPAREEIRQLKGMKREGGRLLVMGGSQGALRLNQIFCQAAESLLKRGVSVTHITGTRDYDWLKSHYNGIAGDIEVLPYCEDMAKVYSCCRLAIARAGASSINEFEIVGIPSVLVPFPAARDDHQTANAKVLEKAGAAVIVREDSMNPDLLRQLVLDFWERPELMHDMSDKALSRARPEAAEKIAEYVLAICK